MPHLGRLFTQAAQFAIKTYHQHQEHHDQRVLERLDAPPAQPLRAWPERTADQALRKSDFQSKRDPSTTDDGSYAALADASRLFRQLYVLPRSHDLVPATATVRELRAQVGALTLDPWLSATVQSTAATCLHKLNTLERLLIVRAGGQMSSREVQPAIRRASAALQSLVERLPLKQG